MADLTEANVTANQPLAIAAGNVTPAGLRLNQVGIGAVNIKKQWYIATEKAGIFLLEAEAKTKVMP